MGTRKSKLVVSQDNLNAQGHIGPIGLNQCHFLQRYGPLVFDNARSHTASHSSSTKTPSTCCRGLTTRQVWHH